MRPFFFAGGDKQIVKLEKIIVFGWENDHEDGDIPRKVLGKINDECEGRTIKEAVAFRPKMYPVLVKTQKYQESQRGKKECDGKRS